MWNLQAGDKRPGVGMLIHDLIFEDTGQGLAKTHVDARAHRTLVQVSLAVRCARGQTHHRHGRVTAVDDDANIGHALVTQLREHRIEVDAVLDEGFVATAAETVLTADDIRQVVRDLAVRHQHAARKSERVAISFAAPGHDENAVAAAALGRLDDETLPVRHDVVERLDLALVCDDAIQLGHGHAGLQRQLLRDGLVIHARIKPARIETHDQLGIALVDPEHARLAQLFRLRKHHCPASALKRLSSSRRYPVYLPARTTSARTTSSSSGNVNMRCSSHGQPIAA